MYQNNHNIIRAQKTRLKSDLKKVKLLLIGSSNEDIKSIRFCHSTVTIRSSRNH